MISFILNIFGRAPLALRRRIGILCGRAIALIPTSDRRVVELHIDRFLGKSISASSVYAHFGIVAAEVINLDPILKNDTTTVHCPELSNFKQIMNRGHGCIALVAHLGNWELLAAYLVKNGIPVTTVGKEARIGALQKVLKSIRERHGVHTYWRSGPGILRDMIKALGENKLVAGLIDQDTRVENVTIPFFGKPAATPVTLVELALRRKIPITSVFIARTSNFNYQVFVEEIPLSSTEEILNIFHARLENLIRRFPEQWVWMHKRWRTKENGERLSSKEYIHFLQHETA